MKINLATRFERQVVEIALSNALDNEHDKGDEGCGSDISTEIEAFLGSLQSDHDRPLDISLIVLGFLYNYLPDPDTGAFDNEADPRMELVIEDHARFLEAASNALAGRLEGFMARTL